MADPFVGEIRLFAGNFVPRGWAFCDGQLFSISQNTALFSLLGTTYGGDGRTTFALPDLRGSVPLQPGQVPGLSDRALGEVGGTETLAPNQLPPHTHSLNAASAAGSSGSPSGNLLAQAATNVYGAASSSSVMSQQAITGGGIPGNPEAMPPYLTLNYIIALQGVFPPRA
jgi:microcystin-dependent protein